MESGIYRIVNKENGRHYIGSSKNLHKRKICHFSYLRRRKHHCYKLQLDYNLFGPDVFEFEVLEYTENLMEREQYYLDTLLKEDSYNLLKEAYAAYGENHPMWGRKHTPEARAKIKAARAKQTIKHSKETREKISRSNKGRKLSPESIEKMRQTKLASKKPAWHRIVLEKSVEKDLIESYKAGYDMRYLAKKFKLSRSTVKRILQENNIEIRTSVEQKKINARRVKKPN